MDKVEAAVEVMIDGLDDNEFGINWALPTANFSKEKTYSWELSESVVNMGEQKAVNDRIRELVVPDLTAIVVAESFVVDPDGAELRAFSINSAIVTKSMLDEKTKRFTYTLRLSYYMAF